MKNKNGSCPFFWTIDKNIMKMIQLLIDYINKNSLIMELNKKVNDGYYPFLKVIDNNNIEIV